MLAAALLTAGACTNGHGTTTRAIARRPVAYRVVYRVDTGGASSYEELVVQRPFLALDVTTPDPPAPGVLGRGTLTSVDRLYRIDPSGVSEVSGRQPAVGTADQALGPLLPDLVARGVAKAVSAKGEVAGRECRMYRFHEPVAGPIKALAGDDHDDLCLDADGLILSEEWHFHGTTALRRVALSVDTAPGDLTPRLSTEGATPPPTAASGAPTVGAADRPPAWIAAPAPPAGFSPAASVSFRFPRTDTPDVPAYTSTVWAFTSGADLITVEAGEGVLPWRADDVHRPATLAGGAAESVLRSDGPEIRRDLGQGRWARGGGTIPLRGRAASASTFRLR
jgi:hypothetical protein